jgi:sugar phosphate isomerase/epimerase
MAFRPLRALTEAETIVKRSGGGGLLLDTLHIQRCGVTPADLEELDPALLSYLQVCDAPARPDTDPAAEARTGRLLPGEGELPLPQILAALPGTLPVSVEAPSAKGDADPAGFARRARRAVAELLEQAA